MCRLNWKIYTVEKEKRVKFWTKINPQFFFCQKESERGHFMFIFKLFIIIVVWFVGEKELFS